MIEPGPHDSLSDLAGVRVGDAEDGRARTGVTALLPDEAAVAVAYVRGGRRAPGAIDARGDGTLRRPPRSLGSAVTVSRSGRIGMSPRAGGPGGELSKRFRKKGGA